MTEFAKTKN